MAVYATQSFVTGVTQTRVFIHYYKTDGVFFVFQEAGYVPDKLFKAHKRVAAYCYDIEAWSVLIRDAQVSKIISCFCFVGHHN